MSRDIRKEVSDALIQFESKTGIARCDMVVYLGRKEIDGLSGIMPKIGKERPRLAMLLGAFVVYVDREYHLNVAKKPPCELQS